MRRAARDPQRNLGRVIAGFFLDALAFDQNHLADVGKVEIRIERRTAPNAPRLDATMVGRRDLNEIRDAAPLERQGDIPFQRWLVALGREMIMRLPFNNIAGQLALREQRVTRNVLAGDVTARKQRDHHADFVGLLLLITAFYG